MIHYLIFSGISLIVGAVAGLMIGRRNPKIAKHVAARAQQVNDAIDKAIK